MKILMINDIGSEMGGAEAMIKQLKVSLIARGHDVKILSGNEYPQKKLINDYEFRSFASHSWGRFLLYIYNPFSRIALKKVLKEFQPDVVHLHNISKASPSILFCLKNYPTIMTAHDIECIDKTIFSKLKSLHPFKENYSSYFEFKKNIPYFVQKLRYAIIREGQKNIDLFIVPSNAMATILREGMIKSPIAIVPNGKEELRVKATAKLKYNERPSKILFVGRLAPEKGLHILIEAIRKVLDVFPNVTLTVVGDGPEADSLKHLVQKYNLRNSVHFTGNLMQDKIIHHFKVTDIVVVPSICYESFGLVVVEAMMHGKPVIASNAGGLSELVDDGITGLLVRPDSAIELGSGIIKLLTDPNMIESMGRASINKAKAYSIKQYVDTHIKLYKKVAL